MHELWCNLLSEEILRLEQAFEQRRFEQSPERKTHFKLVNGGKGQIGGPDHLLGFRLFRKIRTEAAQAGVECHSSNSCKRS